MADFTLTTGSDAITGIGNDTVIGTATDAGGNNVYDVSVEVSDGLLGIDSQAIAVTANGGAGSVPAVSIAGCGGHRGWPDQLRVEPHGGPVAAADGKPIRQPRLHKQFRLLCANHCGFRRRCGDHYRQRSNL